MDCCRLCGRDGRCGRRRALIDAGFSSLPVGGFCDTFVFGGLHSRLTLAGRRLLFRNDLL
jgi:hypothetical protein